MIVAALPNHSATKVSVDVVVKLCAMAGRFELLKIYFEQTYFLWWFLAIVSVLSLFSINDYIIKEYGAADGMRIVRATYPSVTMLSQIPHDLGWDLTWAAEEGSLYLIFQVMA
jgi:hypothetical protein